MSLSVRRGLEAFQALKPISAVTYRMRREKERHDVSTEEGRIEYAKACAATLRGVKETGRAGKPPAHISVENRLFQRGADAADNSAAKGCYGGKARGLS